MMKPHPAILLIILWIVCMVGTGCASMGVKKRIAEKSAVFDKLTAREQKVLQAGFIENDFNKDMVYIALGTPSEIKAKDSPLGKVTTWVYKRYYPNANAGFIDIKPIRSSVSKTGQLSDARGVATAQWGPSLGSDDIPLDTLYVVFIEDEVFGISLESQGGPVEL